jgi:hypothetical protein
MKKSLGFSIAVITAIFYSQNVTAQTWEVYNSKLELQSRLIYDRIDLLSESVRIGQLNGELILLAQDLKPALKLEGTEIYQYLAPWILVKGPQGIGAYHEYGQKVLALEYDEIQTFYNRLLARRGQEYWIFDRGQNKVTSIGTFDEAKFTKLGLLYAKQGNKYFLPLSKNPEKEFQMLSDNDGRYVLTKEDSGFGLLNLEGDYVLDPVIDRLVNTTGNFYYGYDENQYLLIEGNDISANIRYNSFHEITYENGLMLEYIHGKLRRIMEEDGILLDSVGIEGVERIGTNLYNVKFRGDKVGLLGKKGWLVNPTSNADRIGIGSENLFPAQSNGKTGFLDSKGDWMIEPLWNDVQLFSDQIATVKNSNDWQLINTSGNQISSNVWEEIKPFKNGIGIAQNSSKFFLLDKTGSVLNETGYDNISRTADGFFLIEDSGKTGLLSSYGIEVLPLEFQRIIREKKDFIIVQKEGMMGVINDSGDVLLPLAFENVLVDWENGQILTKSLYQPVFVEEITTTKRKKKGA